MLVPPAESADDEDGAVIDHLKLPFPDMGNLSQIAKVGAMFLTAREPAVGSLLCCVETCDIQQHNQQQGFKPGGG